MTRLLKLVSHMPVAGPGLRHRSVAAISQTQFCQTYPPQLSFALGSTVFKRQKVTEVEAPEQLDAGITAAGDNKLVVVQYSAAWCMPCRAITPQVNQLSEDNKDSSLFFYVNIDDHQTMSEDADIEKVPTFRLLKKGVEVDRVIGAKVEMLKVAVEKQLGHAES